MAKIAIVIPVYNVERYLARCLDSVIAQTISDLDIVVVDDGSTDRSGIICDEYAKRDPRIVVIHQNNGGLSVARNAGLSWISDNSNCEWIGFVDSDDWVHPQMYELLYKSGGGGT